MSARELLTMNHPVHAWFYATGAAVWGLTLGLGIFYALVGAIHIVRTLVSAWLNDDPEQLRLPWRAL